MTAWDKYDMKFRYMMLDRLRQDCTYYLGNGGRNPNCLWACDEKLQIETMKAIWNTFSDNDKPEWLPMAKIEELAEKMGVGPKRMWYGIELTRENAELLKPYLREHNIKFEPSEAYNLIHIECLMSEEELKSTNEWINHNIY